MSTIPSYHPIPSILRSELQNVQSPFQLNYLYMFDRLRLIHTGPWILYIPTLQSIEGTSSSARPLPQLFMTHVGRTVHKVFSKFLVDLENGWILGEYWADIG